ncbi:MAG: hypothetical protein COT91_04025 [Candidatus Doudnabacteria bacterium CG10_big_fil_rev_8_21_14_0_10_41_10]|uniref:Uncharacterized protein n=1 Tax=Candidatus Doudnabacteria bacterium CG10_big_fil_rev_8_21_14_0_10_41_10 TaxID=1974551 RepID=A0A2H0VCT6_9BACT|nr:MAG: hypothetical protein COT91_04025 [Candidatus Doudnabacteria bacterium CG10_big_fil_rev_8_21_14_0_10_41_10]
MNTPEIAGRTIKEDESVLKKMSREGFDLTIALLEKYLETEHIPTQFQEKLKQMMIDGADAIEGFESVKTPQELADRSIDIASIRAGLSQIHSEIKEGSLDIFTNVQKGVLSVLVLKLERQLGAFPMPKMDVTSEAGVKALHDHLADKKSSPYAKLISATSEKAREAVKDKVRRLLERFSARISSVERDRLIEKASEVSGKLAFGMTAIGVGFLALGSKAVAAENYDYEVSINEQRDTIKILRTDTGDNISIVPYDELDKYQTDNNENYMFEQMRALDMKSEGVEYQLAEEEKFEEVVVDDGKKISQEIFKKDLEQLSPVEFVKLINVMVEEKLTYDQESQEEDDSGRYTEKAIAENLKISKMPLDEMYSEYGKGVCRHYAALVEKIGEILIEKNLVPNCQGMAIDEVQSFDVMHSWNVYYLNPKGTESSVVMGYTDATRDDSDNTFFDNLEARDADHPSIHQNLQDSFFSRDELGKIYEKLLELDMGEMENRALLRSLAEMDLQKFEESHRASDEELSPADIELLKRVWRNSMEAGVGTDSELSLQALHIFEDSTDYLVEHYKKTGDLKIAAQCVDEGLKVLMLDELPRPVYQYSEKLADLGEQAKELDFVIDVRIEEIEYFHGIDYYFWSQSQKNYAEFLVRNNMFNKLITTTDVWASEVRSEFEKISVYSYKIQGLRENAQIEEADRLLVEVKKLAESYTALPEEKKEFIEDRYSLDKITSSLLKSSVSGEKKVN